MVRNNFDHIIYNSDDSNHQYDNTGHYDKGHRYNANIAPEIYNELDGELHCEKRHDDHDDVGTSHDNHGVMIMEIKSQKYMNRNIMDIMVGAPQHVSLL